MKLLDTLVRAVASRLEGRPSDPSERLRLEVVQLYEDGRYREAEESARRLVEFERETLGERAPGYASALSNLALLLQKQGDRAAAEPLLRQALEIRREALGERHPDSATTLNNLALLLCERGDLNGAEPLLRQSLDIRREVLGELHHDYATSLSSLALLLCERGDLEGAEPLLRQTVAIRREALGDDHPEYATGLNNLALLLYERGDHAGAEPLLRRALEIRGQVLGEDHPDSLVSANALANLLKNRGDGPFPVVPERQRVESERAQDRGADRAAQRHAPVDAKSRISVPLFKAVAQAPTQRSDRDGQGLAEACEDLTRANWAASQQLIRDAGRMQERGLPARFDVLEAAADCHRRFLDLRAEAFHLAARYGLDDVSTEEVPGILELGALIDTVIAAEDEWLRRRADLLRARAVAEQVQALSCRDDRDRSLLQSCQDSARRLHEAFSVDAIRGPHPEADRICRGEHPIVSLVTLIQDNGDLAEDDWSRHFRAVTDAFGKPLAIAAARGRIVWPARQAGQDGFSPASREPLRPALSGR